MSKAPREDVAEHDGNTRQGRDKVLGVCGDVRGARVDPLNFDQLCSVSVQLFVIVGQAYLQELHPDLKQAIEEFFRGDVLTGGSQLML